jgi:hypothetical protein
MDRGLVRPNYGDAQDPIDSLLRLLSPNGDPKDPRALAAIAMMLLGLSKSLPGPMASGMPADMGAALQNQPVNLPSEAASPIDWGSRAAGQALPPVMPQSLGGSPPQGFSGMTPPPPSTPTPQPPGPMPMPQGGMPPWLGPATAIGGAGMMGGAMGLAATRFASKFAQGPAAAQGPTATPIPSARPMGPPAIPAMERHTIQPGDTVTAIARHLLGPDATDRDVQEMIGKLANANGVADPNRLRSGQAFYQPPQR